eukprot:CAMPEP_0206537136 /NCGR_PEP_ID=MMETSP0325_2-20121206/7151_1 /ASSEMBLY_ACC=CAM_ASM_000347 /TAXON_ID=2866 /ORGANISM="Crypthecodinium cohnii, Strain Seligo" /LENGTH=595 /DNA_ID=CAMNT_0054034453 /DNA_START=436 /DNA_END=2223 /DNA_ORIENTATION=-
MGDLVLGAQSQSLVELAAILKFDLMSWCLNGALHVRLAADANSHCVASLRPSCSELADHDDVADHHASEVATELEGGQDALSEGASGKEGSLPSSFHTKGPVLSGVVEGNIVHVALSFREMGLGGGLELEAGADLLDPAACDAVPPFNYDTAPNQESERLLEEITMELEKASPEALADRQVALKLVSTDGAMLEHLPNIWGDDDEVAWAAMENDAFNLEFVSPRLRGNKDFVLKTVKRDGRALRYASEELLGDREVVLEGVQNAGYELKFASEELRADRELVLVAVKSNCQALAHAADALRVDKELALQAVKCRCKDLAFIARDEWKQDREVVLEAAKQSGWALRHVSADFRDDKEIGLAAVGSDPRSFEFLSERLRQDREIVIKVFLHFREVPRNLKLAGPNITKDKDLMLLAVRCSMSGRLREERESWELADPSVRASCPFEVCLAAAESSLAIEGQAAPVLTVISIKHVPLDFERLEAPDFVQGNNNNDNKDNNTNNNNSSSNNESKVTTHCFCCEVTMMSGKSFRCQILDSIERPATLNELAKNLVEDISKSAEVCELKHVFLAFASTDNQDYPASVVPAWDWNRHLSDFL